MTNYQTVTKKYLDKIERTSKSASLITSTKDLLADFQNFSWPIATEKIIIRPAQKADLPQVENIIRNAYNWRYCGRDGALMSAFSETSDSPDAVAFVAVISFHDKDLVLATTRLVRQNLELFRFFQPADQQLWPHQQKKLVPYEFERLAFHPVLDATRDLAMKQLLLEKLVKTAKKTIKEKKYWLGCTMSANVKKFMDQTQVKTTLIPNLVFFKNDYTEFLTNLFPRYFEDFSAYEIN